MKNLLLLVALCATICFGCETEKPETEDLGPEIASTGIDFKNLIFLNRQNIQTVRDLLPGNFVSENTEMQDDRETTTLKYRYDTNLGNVTFTHSFVDGVLRTSNGAFNYTSPAKALKDYKVLSNDINKAVYSGENQYVYKSSIMKGTSPEWSSTRYYGADSENGRGVYFIDLDDVIRSHTPTGDAKDYLDCRESWVISGLNPMLDNSKTAACNMDSNEKDAIIIRFSIQSFEY